MGIRVDEEALDHQLTEAGCDDRESFLSRSILNRTSIHYRRRYRSVPYLYVLLRKAHIGEVHVSIWPESITKAAEEAGVNLL